MADTLHEFLSTLPERTFDSPEEFEKEVVPELVRLLGYDESNLHFQVAIEPQYDLLPDAEVSRRPSKRPYLLLEADYEEEHISEKTREMMRDYGQVSGAEYVVLIDQNELVVQHDGEGEQRVVDLNDLDEATTSGIAEQLHPPQSLPDEPIVEYEPPEDRIINTEHFTLDLDHYESILETVRDPDSTQEKGESLEELAALLFDGIEATKTVEQNVYGESSEVDVVARYEGKDDYTFFEEYNRYVMVECKNWSKSIGAKQIRDFKGKLQTSNVDLGIFFAQDGVTGGSRGEFALGELDLAFRNEDIAIVVVDDRDLEWIRNGNSFYDLLEKKLYTLRFRRKSSLVDA
ncbi:restriction endonuclease [Halospeciosus flavus]|uniref:Restriction endonuclease n=1 Tax=Halospeciosus flavus TaxID=3032283 RepID=A0ABD5Z529_9EURY|nr:restriction endonuclease [Halospeciosus flavus]